MSSLVVISVQFLYSFYTAGGVLYVQLVDCFCRVMQSCFVCIKGVSKVFPPVVAVMFC